MIGEIGLEILRGACRYFDNLIETKTFPEIIEGIGVSVSALLHVAEQRALRVVLLMRGRPIPSELTTVSLSKEELDLQSKFTAAWIDGFVVGFRSAK